MVEVSDPSVCRKTMWELHFTVTSGLISFLFYAFNLKFWNQCCDIEEVSASTGLYGSATL